MKTEVIFFGTWKPVLVFWNTDTARFGEKIIVTLDYVARRSACVRVFCNENNGT